MRLHRFLGVTAIFVGPQGARYELEGADKPLRAWAVGPAGAEPQPQAVANGTRPTRASFAEQAAFDASAELPAPTAVAVDAQMGGCAPCGTCSLLAAEEYTDPPDAGEGRSELTRRRNKYRVAREDYGKIDSDDPRMVTVECNGAKADKCKLHKLCADRFDAMRLAALAADAKLDFKINNGWRKNKYNDDMSTYCSEMNKHENSDKEKPYEGAAMVSGRPNAICVSARNGIAFQSPHETGLAFDLGSEGFSPNFDGKTGKEYMLKLKGFKWLMANAHKYGITPFKNEPWHWECVVPLAAWTSGEEFLSGTDRQTRVACINKDGINNFEVMALGDKPGYALATGPFKAGGDFPCKAKRGAKDGVCVRVGYKCPDQKTDPNKSGRCPGEKEWEGETGTMKLGWIKCCEGAAAQAPGTRSGTIGGDGAPAAAAEKAKALGFRLALALVLG